MKMAQRLPLAFEPGSRWSYSNTGYVLLGILVHEATGRFYGDVLKDRVFGPLGMKTARVISESDIVPNRAAGYRLAGGELKNQEWVAPRLNTTADGSLYLTILDFVAWERGAPGESRPEARELEAGLHARRAEEREVVSPYGFGWNLDEQAGHPKIHHGGAWQGFKSYICRWLGPDLTIVALANLAEANPRPRRRPRRGDPRAGAPEARTRRRRLIRPPRAGPCPCPGR